MCTCIPIPAYRYPASVRSSLALSGSHRSTHERASSERSSRPPHASAAVGSGVESAVEHASAADGPPHGRHPRHRRHRRRRRRRKHAGQQQQQQQAALVPHDVSAQEGAPEGDIPLDEAAQLAERMGLATLPGAQQGARRPSAAVLESAIGALGAGALQGANARPVAPQPGGAFWDSPG